MTPRTERARPLVDPMLPRQLRHQVRRNQFDHLTQDRTLCAGSAGLVFFHTPAFGRKTSTCRATPFFPSSYGMAVLCEWPISACDMVLVNCLQRASAMARRLVRLSTNALG